MSPFFDCIFIEEEFGVGKPDVRIYQAALQQLCLAANEVWMVGDNLRFDVEAAQQLGIFALWFDSSYQGLPLQAQVRPNGIIHTLPELLPYIEGSIQTSSPIHKEGFHL